MANKIYELNHIEKKHKEYGNPNDIAKEKILNVLKLKGYNK